MWRRHVFRNVKKFTPDYAARIAEDFDLRMDYSQGGNPRRRVDVSGAVRGSAGYRWEYRTAIGAGDRILQLHAH